MKYEGKEYVAYWTLNELIKTIIYGIIPLREPE
jgi:hypothetical protein